MGTTTIDRLGGFFPLTYPANFIQAPLIEHKRSALLHAKSGKINFTKGCLEIFIANFKHDARCFMGRSGNGLFLICF